MIECCGHKITEHDFISYNNEVVHYQCPICKKIISKDILKAEDKTE